MGVNTRNVSLAGYLKIHKCFVQTKSTSLPSIPDVQITRRRTLPEIDDVSTTRNKGKSVPNHLFSGNWLTSGHVSTMHPSNGSVLHVLFCLVTSIVGVLSTIDTEIVGEIKQL